MVTLVVGSILTNLIREEFAPFERVAAASSRLPVDVADLPMSREVAEVVVPVGILMGVWVFVYELQRPSRSD
jgi:hypothetical protein